MTQRLTAAQFQAQYGNGAKVDPASGAKPQIRLPAPRKMNKTEAEYHQILLRRYPAASHFVLYEPWSFKLPSGTRYTPDFVVMGGPEILEVVETKGAHIHSSASIRAFKEARAAYPFVLFTFAQKTKDGWATA